MTAGRASFSPGVRGAVALASVTARTTNASVVAINRDGARHTRQQIRLAVADTRDHKLRSWAAPCFAPRRQCGPSLEVVDIELFRKKPGGSR
jgi:hypothetical protein